MNLLSGNPPAIRFAKNFQLKTIGLLFLMSGKKGLRRYSNPCTKMFPLKIFRGLRCKSLTECDLASAEEAKNMGLSDKKRICFGTLLISYEIQTRGKLR